MVKLTNTHTFRIFALHSVVNVCCRFSAGLLRHAHPRHSEVVHLVRYFVCVHQRCQLGGAIALVRIHITWLACAYWSWFPWWQGDVCSGMAEWIGRERVANGLLRLQDRREMSGKNYCCGQLKISWRTFSVTLLNLDNIIFTLALIMQGVLLIEYLRNY